MLKQSKCFWYFLSYKFIRGEATLHWLKGLPHYELVIPQHLGIDAVIKLLDVWNAAETLRAFTSSLSTPNLWPTYNRWTRRVDKGTDWCKKVISSNLSQWDVWFCFFCQAKPSMSYRLVLIMDPQHVVEGTSQSLFFECLAPMGVNWNITRGWRMLLLWYQGLGLLNMALEELSESISIQWLLCHWGIEDGVGKVIQEAYERLQIETGLSGNIFLW